MQLNISQVILTSLLFWMTIADAMADGLPERWKRAEIAVGGYLATFGSDLRVDGDTANGSVGTNLDLENQLNLDSELATFRADGYWRFLYRHRLELTYYDISREGTRTLDQQIQFRDQVFDVGATVSSSLDSRVAKAAYAYSVLQNDQWDGALSLGANAFNISASLQAEASGLGSVQRSTADTIAPLPTIGGRLWYAFADDWTARLDADFFALEAGDYKGSLIDAEVVLDYDITSWLGVSLGYNYVNLDVDKTGGSFDASI